MSKVRIRDTSPELALRSELHRRGLRYRVHRRPAPDVHTQADLVFGPARVVVYVDGCFWHGCPEHGSLPKANREFWRRKFARNEERDAEVNRLLAENGWTVVRVWEHEPAEEAADRIESVLSHGVSPPSRSRKVPR